jgi:hypothetical protein
VLPDINGQEGLVPAGEGVSGVGGVEDGDVVLVLGKPGPAGAEVGHCLVGELLEEFVDGAPLGYDDFLELALGFGLVGGDAVPVEGVVPVLGRVVEDLGVLAAA